MKTAFRRSFAPPGIPGYSTNAVLQLLVASATGFITYHLIKIVMVLAGSSLQAFFSDIAPNVALPAASAFPSKFWTIFTYGWAHRGFWELFTNMIWLYCFGNVLQGLVGYKQIIPLFVYSLAVGGLAYVGAQLLGPAFGAVIFMDRFPTGYIGAQAGVMGLAAAALTIAPGYRLYITQRLGIPLYVIALIFAALMVLSSGLQGAILVLMAGGGVMGFAYATLLKSGYQPGIWVYNLRERMDRAFAPDENKALERHRQKRKQVLSRMYAPKQGITQKKIDDLLDKINQQGYQSLTKEEKDMLLRASKE